MAGAVSTTVVAPFDLLESRMVYQKHKGMLQLTSDAIRNHGKYNAGARIYIYFKYIYFYNISL